MALTIGFGLFVLSVLTATLARVLAEEIAAWSPSIIQSLVKFAVHKLPSDRRECFSEEWQSHVNDVPGTIAKVLVAVGLLRAAYEVSFRDGRAKFVSGWVEVSRQLDEARLLATEVVNLIQNDKVLSERVEFTAALARVKSSLSAVEERQTQLGPLYVRVSNAPNSLIKDFTFTLRATNIVDVRTARPAIARAQRHVC